MWYMSRTNHNSKGIFKQQMMRREKSPTREATERAEEWLFDNETLRIFVDASELNYQGIFGLAVCVVGQGETIVHSKKHYNQKMKKMNVYAEAVAIDYALDLLHKTINNYTNQPLRVIVYSDWKEVDNLDTKPDLTKIPAINEVVERIQVKRSRFAYSQEIIGLEIGYMGKELKRYNPYFRASHNAARKILGKDSR